MGYKSLNDVVNDWFINYSHIKSPSESVNLVAAASTGTININLETSAIWFYTSNATNNWTINFRYSANETLNSKLSVGESTTFVFMSQQGATAYYPSTIAIDGSSVTPKWQGGVAPTAGNASSIDIYSFTIVKTAASTYTVFGSQTRYA